MARETKVGLLAGLAFIICFAIILANRGRHDFITRQVKQLVDRSAVPQEAVPSTSVPGGNGDRHVVSDQNRGAPDRPSSDDADGEPERHDDSEGDSSVERVASASPDSGSAARSNGTPLTAPSTLASADRIRRLERRIEELDAELRARQVAAPAEKSETAEPLPPTKEAPPPPAVKPKTATVYHTVAAGETLSKIANAYYGAQSQTHINAIFDANRSALADANTIIVGMKLAIPAVPGVTPLDQSTSTAKGPRPRGKEEATRPASPASRPFRWYQIKKNDRYVTIAREELGSESRWREIYEMNKSMFPDQGQIREGVRIKLPVLDVADASGRRQ